jgi:predicted ATPase
MPFWLSITTVIHGWAIAEQGEVEAGIAEIRKGLADFAATGATFLRPYLLGLLAEQYGRAGNIERAHTQIAEAIAASERSGGRWCQPELYRVRGDLHVAASDDVSAEAAYARSVEIARYHGARALELRSASRLAGLWVRNERPAEVEPLLGPVIDAMTGVIGLPDLDLARSLLAGRSASAPK